MTMKIEQLQAVQIDLEIMSNKIDGIIGELMVFNSDKKAPISKFRKDADELIKSLKTSLGNKRLKKEDTMNEMFDIICSCANVERDKLINSGRSRKREYVLPRQVCMAFSIHTFKQTQDIAAGVFGLDHSTAIHAYKTIRNLFQTNRNFRDVYKPVIDFCISYDEKNDTRETLDYLEEM